MQTIAIIVTFNPDARLIENVNSLLTQVDQIIIVDNGSGESGLSILQTLHRNVTVLYNKANLGLATALNQAARLAVSKNPIWILTFDQDSVAPEGFVNSLITTYEACPYANEVAIVGPVYKDQVTGRLLSVGEIPSPTPCQVVPYTWTSGCLMKASIFDSVGYFRDEFFIDYIDVEYCLRCQRYGFRTIVASSALLLHNQGAPAWKRFLGRRVIVNEYSPLRRYYNARNRIIVYMENLFSLPKWVVGDIYLYSKQLAKMMILEDARWLKLRWVLRGIRDGFLRRGGAYTNVG